MTWDPYGRLLTIEEAARAVDRPTSTIRRWITEGRLTPTAALGHRKLYRESDVLAADADAHRGRRRPRGVRPRTPGLT
ncbi:helix-turn-helix domain-containing protein [Luteipulveratus halotolerans]|uniref:Helix-turn-helix domain-containing protein n=1 Tax=Luteipulveratus halotolerans TaxID=1631356 RepID=A0A0L6CKP9_9MICO|nr:helix-turn-helix domain-containing protein [Luteipulveratus halotolerans]KNX38088.1 hypothetical protein VV01_14560 [Luteipulveratus halotolerans]